jgi:small subunit ribosomal protein S20
MPVTVGALRKLRADGRKTAINLRIRKALKEAVSVARKKSTEKNLKQAYSLLDRAAKHHIIHKNKAARLKSRLSSLVKKK